MFVWGTRRPPVDRVRPVAKPMAAGWADRLWPVNLSSDAQTCPILGSFVLAGVLGFQWHASCSSSLLSHVHFSH
jgi:hypothetical protein